MRYVHVHYYSVFFSIFIFISLQVSYYFYFMLRNLILYILYSIKFYCAETQREREKKRENVRLKTKGVSEGES